MADALASRADEQGREGPRVLIVAVASQGLSPELIDVREQAAAGPTQFYLVLP